MISNPQDYWIYYNTTDGCSYVYINGSWSIIAHGGKSIRWIGSYESAPLYPSLYDCYFNTTDGCSYIYDGSIWTLIATKGEKGEQGIAGINGKPIIWLGSYNSEPIIADELYAYYNTYNGCSYIYHDGSWNILASAGVSIEWLGSFDEAPSNPSLYNAYFNNLTGCSYIYDGKAWTLLASKGDVGETGAPGANGADGADGRSIVWKGSYAFASDLENPEELWAFYNTSDGCSYIFSGGKWNLLASSSSMDNERTMVIGTVEAEDRESKAGIYVTLTSISSPEIVYKTYTNSSGYFAFSSLSQGEYLVSIAESGYESKTSESISVSRGAVSDCGLIRLQLEKGKLIGHVELDATNDYSNVQVNVNGTSYSTTTDVNGIYV